ncbi:glycoside hydrolase family 130 protein [Aquirhabdus parva]|uniref:Glycosyl hydrolase family 32 N-terminal domain-containing protein n=1 Tax=Aquirhabdus parva TaxID=2283318 RepID=A0A345P907_9GAMM|nr:hypothetical protein [Aquirhabdus parva]AXI03766.1 hypothetical protein HYN46_13545 [Aquirhabdus parva]
MRKHTVSPNAFKINLLLILSLSLPSAFATPPLPADLVDNNLAFLKLDKVNTAIGGAFSMHFISTVTINGTIWAYYIKGDGNGKMGVGLAKSTDGVTFADQGVVLQAGAAGAWDDRMASFPGIWYDNGTFYLVYEGAGQSTSSPGDIGLATSSDGVHFTKNSTPILYHNQTGWEAANIGTPSLYKEGATWYLHYHGFDGVTCQIGVATGTSLTALTKFSANPIIKSVPNTWQAGTAGHRGIVKNNGKYYMAYEGSGVQPYGTAQWSSGFASSTDLLNWTTFSQNNVLPLTTNTMGNDGSTLFSVNGSNYLYYRAPGANVTRRALIADEANGGFDQQWTMTNPNIQHVVGRAEVDGWSVNVHDTANYMQFGPYTTTLQAGNQIATWKLQVDNNTADNGKIVRLEVYDVDAGTAPALIGQRDITRKQWKQANRFEYFSVPFNFDSSRVGHRIELRVWWYGISYVKEQVVGIS